MREKALKYSAQARVSSMKVATGAQTDELPPGGSREVCECHRKSNVRVSAL